jgi:hypothetical protein
MSLNK